MTLFFKHNLKKLLIILDSFKSKKSFLIEKNISFKNRKISETFIDYHKKKFDQNLYVQGNFENQVYFQNYREELINLFSVKEKYIVPNNPLIYQLKNSNSISIHIRRNRFSDQSGLINQNNINKSANFTNQIIDYINRSIIFMNNKINNPTYFIWSNDFSNFDEILNKINLQRYILVKNNNNLVDFDLFKYAKNFIVGPSSYHWWGAWLNQFENKICVCPKNLSPSNNKNFWPADWFKI